MFRILFFAFIAYALTSVYIQTADMAIKQFSTPFMDGLVALCAIVGIIYKRINFKEGIILTAVWVLAAVGDIFFEMSRLSTTSDDKARFFIIAVAVFLIAYLSLGITFTVLGIKARLNKWKYAVILAISIIMGLIAYKSLLVVPGQNALIIIYTVQAVILLFGGLLSLLSGRYAFAVMGVLLFLSDWLVGLRAFGDPAVVPAFVRQHVLILILLTYYIPMMASIDYSFGMSARKE